ncbi:MULTISPECIES: hypothetical protein [Brasilonema]|jgi:hypothetical protein|uniref:hypothetical protein n=1 Tax=Brasilonema sennae TaxID=1397703 RepID=UPI001FEBA4DD|nr:MULTISPECIES: hypothetical protein [Brasilonema]
MLSEIISVYAIIDDLLKAIGHDEDCRRGMSDAEIITTAGRVLTEARSISFCIYSSRSISSISCF